MLARLKASGLLWPSLMTLVMLPLLLGLGTWQMQRKAWKEGLLAQRAALGRQAPVDAGADLLTANPAEYTRVRLSGRFLHDYERYWFSDGPQGSGFHVFTPFELASGPVAQNRTTARPIVWINRGYIPARLRDPAQRAQGQLQGPIILTGVVRIPGERNAFTPPNDVAKNIWFWKDLPALHASAFPGTVPLVPVMVDVDAQPELPGGWPKGGTAQAPLSNRHLEYALTWYGLAATLIVVFCVFAYGRLARAAE